MPKRTKPQILHSVIDQIAAKLQRHNIPKDSIKEASTKLRVLDSRASNGSLGRGDSRESRAAVILATIYAQKTRKRLPWKELALAVGVKTAVLEQVQSAVQNSLFDHEAPETQDKKRRSFGGKTSVSAQKVARRNTHTTARGVSSSDSRETNSSSTAEATTKSLGNPYRLFALAIRLVDFLGDPHSVSRKALSLLNQLHQSETTRTLCHMMKREAAYEAAALFVTVCAGQTGTKERDSDGGNKTLKLRDLEKESVDFTPHELKQVLPHVEKFFLNQNRASAHPKNSAEVDSHRDMDITEEAVPSKEEMDDTIFLQWRERALKNALENHRGTGKVKLSPSQALGFVADGVFREFGLL